MQLCHKCTYSPTGAIAPSSRALGAVIASGRDWASHRWQADTTSDAWGTWIYLQDQDSGAVWSAGYQPTRVTPTSQQVLFYPHQAEFQRRDHDIALHMQITVAADDDVEIRQITLINHSDQDRHLRLVSYGEVLLAPQAEQHPAFNKLFIESEYLPENNMLLFHRRPRAADEKPIYLGHLLITNSDDIDFQHL